MGTFYGMSIMFTKLSILHFYLRFLVARPHLRKIIYAMGTIVVAYSFVTSFEWLYVCQPLEKYWDLTITGGSCVNRGQFGVFSGVMNVVTDAIILLFPLALLRDMRNLPLWTKAAVTGIMMTGGFVVVISIIRAKKNADMLHTIDVTWDAAQMVTLW
ncbi:integral membrane [Pyrenophora seminiperda CCB06]|uniref:Integral membrane n=1 Tax=Pyrenophora seminiperda CCB06 TaxID=1302712 RepID=A0A3M7MD45_9PLEO|nr:integral membrane [Pyrenophora seminiperda CCB06]